MILVALGIVGCTTPEPADDSVPEPVPTTGGTGPTMPPIDTGVDPGTPFSAIWAAPVEPPQYGAVVRVSWVQRAKADVSLLYWFDEGDWRRSPVRSLDAGPHEELLLGVPFGATVRYRLVSDGIESEERMVQAGPLPSVVPLPEVVTYDRDGVDPDVPYVLVGVTETGGLSGRTWILLLDRQARPVWAHPTPTGRNSMHPRVSRPQTSFLVDHSSYFSDLQSGGADSQVVELKIDGSVVRTWDTPGHHHPFTDLPDGSIAWAAYQFSGTVGFDDTIEVVRPGGQVETLFSCRSFLSSRGLNLGCGSNTLNYFADRDVFLFSMFTLDSIFEVNGTTGEVERIFGTLARPPFASSSGFEWNFSPPSSQFDYQHAPSFTEDDTLLLSTHRSEESNELVVREYELNNLTDTLEQVWSFGEGEGLDGCQMGEAHRLPSGNTLHNHGTHAVLREIAKPATVVWDLRWEDQEYSCFGGLDTPGHQIVRAVPVGPDLYRFAPERP